MSTKIHPKNVHENSPKVSTRIHLLSPQEVCHPQKVEQTNRQTHIDKLLYRYLPYDTVHNQVGQMRKQKQNYNVCVQWKEHDTKIFCNFKQND